MAVFIGSIIRGNTPEVKKLNRVNSLIRLSNKIKRSKKNPYVMYEPTYKFKPYKLLSDGTILESYSVNVGFGWEEKSNILTYRDNIIQRLNNVEKYLKTHNERADYT